MHGSVISFGGPVESEEFLLHSAEVVFYAFQAWLELQENGTSLLADMSLVDEVLGGEYEADREMVCAALHRLVEVASRGPFVEMVWLFTSLERVWAQS